MNKFFLFFIIGLFLSNFSYANEVGFSSGSEFQVNQLSGDVVIYCNNGQMRLAHCFGDHLSPKSYDYFIGPQLKGATNLQLSSPVMNGKVKTSKYDANNGKSSKEFNLWLRTLLQKPLLEVGLNTITYTLMNDSNEVLKSGEFNVNVTKGESRVCPRGSYYSNIPEDCTFGGYQNCSAYFRQYNYCE